MKTKLMQVLYAIQVMHKLLTPPKKQENMNKRPVRKIIHTPENCPTLPKKIMVHP